MDVQVRTATLTSSRPPVRSAYSVGSAEDILSIPTQHWRERSTTNSPFSSNSKSLHPIYASGNFIDCMCTTNVNFSICAGPELKRLLTTYAQKGCVQPKPLCITFYWPEKTEEATEKEARLDASAGVIAKHEPNSRWGGMCVTHFRAR